MSRNPGRLRPMDVAVKRARPSDGRSHVRWGGRRAQLTTYLPALLSALAQLGKLLVEIQNHLQFWPMERIIRDAAIAAREAVKDLDTSMHILRDDFADDPSAGSRAPV